MIVCACASTRTVKPLNCICRLDVLCKQYKFVILNRIPKLRGTNHLQALNLDLTCPLELQTKDCNKDHVAIVNDTAIRLVGTQHIGIVACASTSATQCQQEPIRGLSVLPITGPNIAGPSTLVYVQHTRGSNILQMYADTAPEWTQKRRQAAEAAAIDVRLLTIAVVGASGMGMVHYNRAVAQYFHSLPLCSAHITWGAFVSARTLARLQAIGPCKTEQTTRDNFVFFHSAELGIDFVDSTVLAFFKTANGHNCVADMRTIGNIARVSVVTNALLFDVLATREMRLGSNSGITTVVDANTAHPLLVGDVYTHTPSPPTPSSNGAASTPVELTLLVPDPLYGPVQVNSTLQYPTMPVSLPFPGVYTLIEDSMVHRQGGQMLSSRSKTYLHVRKRTATQAQINNAQIVARMPLQHLQLTNIVVPSVPHNVATGRTPHSVVPADVKVVDGLTDDAVFQLVHSVAPPCERSAHSNRYNTNIAINDTSIDSSFPCHVSHQISGVVRRVTYFRDIYTRQVYASYVDWARTE